MGLNALKSLLFESEWLSWGRVRALPLTSDEFHAIPWPKTEQSASVKEALFESLTPTPLSFAMWTAKDEAA